MSLIIEDGTVVPNANSFISLEDANSMASSMGLGEITESNLIRSYDLISQAFERRLLGSLVSPFDQTGCFPRKGVFCYGVELPSDKIPLEVKKAQVSIALDIANESAFENNKGDFVSSKSLDGVSSKSFKQSGEQGINSFKSAEKYLNKFLLTNSKRPRNITLVR